MHRATPFLAAASALLAITTAPIASASPGEQPCSDAVGSTSCQRPGNAQVYTAPRTMPRFLPPPSTPGGVLSDTAHGSRNTDLTRSGRHSAITRNTAGFSLAPPFCRLL